MNTQTATEPLSWHQTAAIRREYRLRKKAAHIRRPDYIRTGLAYCGHYEPSVYVERENAHNLASRVCKKCARAAELDRIAKEVQP